ncbi:MAG: hypothetical protein ACOY3I_06420 [Verrucomicrobiota bacterium]
MNSVHSVKKSIPNRQNGVALATTLLIGAFLSFSLISYLGILEYRHSATKDILHQAQTAFVLDSALQEALAKIMDGTELLDPANNRGAWTQSGEKKFASANMTASPGLMSVRYFNENAQTSAVALDSANPRYIPLFSYQNSSNELFNFNTPNNPFYPGENYLTGFPDQNNPPVCVQWIPVYRENTNNGQKILVGRYAYWVDVENTKINLTIADRPFAENQWSNTYTGDSAQSLEWWLRWQQNNGQRPRIADGSLVNWKTSFDFIPDTEARLAAQNSLTNYLQSLASGSTLPFNFTSEIYSLLDPQNSFFNWKFSAVLRKILSSATLYSRDEECDPLGQAKINLVLFLQEGANTNSASYQNLWSRLTNSQYHLAYHPGATPKSFTQSLENFGGAAVAEQMLANIVEYSKPHTQRPELDRTNRGIIGVKAIPYVKEATTRAYSALRLLPSNACVASNFITNSNGIYMIYTNALTGRTPDNKQTITNLNIWYLTNVVIDVNFTFQQPRLHTNTNFEGNMTLYYDWASTSDVQYTTNAQLSFPIILPSSSNIYLGIIPGQKILNAPTALQIQRWDIKKSNVIFHTVPLPHLGQNLPARNWWQMAHSTNNAGITNHISSFYEYQKSNIAIGWFLPRTCSNILGFGSNNIYIDPTLYGTNWLTDTRCIQAVRDLIRTSSITNTNITILKEHVQSIDPALGHRTGNPELWFENNNKRGHFYGVLGHSWRHRDDEQDDLPREELFVQRYDGEHVIHRETTDCQVRPATNTNSSNQPYVRGELMTSVGEIGFVHSGLLQTLILLHDQKGDNQNALDFSNNGPPIAMLLDLFSPGAYRNNQIRATNTMGSWSNSFTTNSPENPRRGVWNVNTTLFCLDEEGKLKSENLKNRGWNQWLNFTGGTNTNINILSPLAHFNSEASYQFTNRDQVVGTALVANQISTSANAFTIHAVAQSIREVNGEHRVVGEKWARVIVDKVQDTNQTDPDTQAPFQNNYRILDYQTRNHSR